MIRDIRTDPGRFGAEEVRDILIGIVLVPGLIIVGGLILFFILGYTDILGRALGFFKVLFWIGIVVTTIVLLMVRKIITWIMRITKRTTNTVIHEVVYDKPLEVAPKETDS